MKKCCFLLILISMCSVSCRGKNEIAQSEPYEANIIEEIYQEEPEEDIPGTIECVMVAGSYWNYHTQGTFAGKMTWLEAAVPGEVVRAYKNPSPTSQIPAEIKRNVIRTTDNEVRDFVHIVHNGTDCWAQDYSIVIDAKPGIITRNSVPVYVQQEKTYTVNNFVLGTGEIVGVYNESAAKAGDFVRINVYDFTGGRLIENRYIEADCVSTAKADLLAMQVYAKLSAKDRTGAFVFSDSIVRKEVIESILTYPITASVRDLFSEMEK